ncbi:MAG: enoyl-CoA hydratase/isomerase family protein [Gammaproteobacteria bacterium]|nr:enoyl-CoA hydratase/isomerase family protein [Gammaproteobacteria bacterium]
MSDYFDNYEHLLFERKQQGILLVTINRPDVYNATNARLHWELSRVWNDISDDPKTRVVVVTGAGKAFCAGGDLAMVEGFYKKAPELAATMKEASDLVYNMVNCEKPIISAINGVAVGAGLAVALMADISIIAEDARITDGHLRLGVGAGDHAAIIWPLLCGMAKAKYYLLTAEFCDGKEAERIGLVSLCRPRDEVLPKAMETAEKLARGPQFAVRTTKRALNGWVRQAGPIFDHSLATEMLAFFHDDVGEGVQAIKEKRDPSFPSAQD